MSVGLSEGKLGRDKVEKTLLSRRVLSTYIRGILTQTIVVVPTIETLLSTMQVLRTLRVLQER